MTILKTIIRLKLSYINLYSKVKIAENKLIKARKTLKDLGFGY